MTEGRLEVESKSQECLVIIKREVTSNNLPKRRVPSSTHGVVGGRRLATASYPIIIIFHLKKLPQTFKSIPKAQFLQMLFLLHFEHIVFCFNLNISKLVEFHASSIENFDKSTE